MKRVAHVSSAVILLCAFGAIHSRHSLAAQPRTAEDPQVTFNRDVAPILFHHCAMCHRPGESGPFPLLTYKDAKSHARQLAAVTQSRFMPPWLPEPGEFKFADEMRLSDAEVALIAKWVEQGAAEGAARPRRPSRISWKAGRWVGPT